MRIKKGFTLAEILIVLMVIGVIATMTIPSLMKGVAEAQYKAAYKKAYNAIVNLAAMEKVAGQLPTQAKQKHLQNFAESMFSNLSVKEFVASNVVDGGELVYANEPVSSVKIGTRVLGPDSNPANTFLIPASGSADQRNQAVSWMVTDDGIAYSLLVGGVASSGDCGVKAEIATSKNAAEAYAKSCGIVVVDVNGLYKGPNRLEIQDTKGSAQGAAADTVSSNAKMLTLSRDRYYIYLGSDGATAGPASTTVSGRIIADMK